MIISCRWDYLKITDDQKRDFGVHCGVRTGTVAFVSGNLAFLAFYSDFQTQARGFKIFFDFLSFGKWEYNMALEHASKHGRTDRYRDRHVCMYVEGHRQIGWRSDSH